MRVINGSRSIDREQGPFSIAIGIFDGVHLGHRALLDNARTRAERDGIASLAYTFDPHPASVLAPDHAPDLLEPLDLRLQRFEAHGMSAALVERFDKEFSGTSPEAFISEILVGKLRALHVIVGEGFSFGKNQGGNVEMLKDAGEANGFGVYPIAHVEVDGERVSSTRIRELISRGEMPRAARLLGRHYELQGSVVRGAGRGAKIGIPTANIDVENALKPGTGVYAGRIQGPFGEMPAVINVGYTPTFGGRELKIEAHILGYNRGHLYGTPVSLTFLQKLREEQKFDGVESLKAQINKDIEAARGILEAGA